MEQLHSNIEQQQAGLDNIGGVEALWYTLASNLMPGRFPAQGPLTIDELDLVPGAVWHQLVSVRGSVKLEQKPKFFSRHGTGFTPRLTGALARHTPELAASLETMEDGRFVVLYRDLNGQVQLVGTPEQPLEWQDSYSAGSETTRNGYDWTLSGEALRRARPYLGTWQVSESGLETGFVLQPGGGGDGSVHLRTAGGQLLATVPAGKSIVLKSGFKLAYEII